MATNPRKTAAAAAATAAHVTYSAMRALDDPVRLARAARIVRAALARNRLTVADLVDVAIADPIPVVEDGEAA